MKEFIKEREERLKKGEEFNHCVFRCVRCTNVTKEKVPKSEGWQPFGIYDCSECGAKAPVFIGYTFKDEQ